MRTVLVTGGAGFIGSAFVRMLQRESGFAVVDADQFELLTDRLGKSSYWEYLRGLLKDSR